MNLLALTVTIILNFFVAESCVKIRLISSTTPYDECSKIRCDFDYLMRDLGGDKKVPRTFEKYTCNTAWVSCRKTWQGGPNCTSIDVKVVTADETLSIGMPFSPIDAISYLTCNRDLTWTFPRDGKRYIIDHLYCTFVGCSDPAWV